MAGHGVGALARRNRRALLAAIVALHGLVVAGLIAIGGLRETVVDAAPVFLAVLAPPPPAATLPRALPPPPRTVPTPPPLALPPIAPEPSPAISTLVAQVATPAPPAPAAPAPVAPPLPAPAPTARTLPTSAVQYLVPPAPAYSRVSARMKESGKVVVRVFIDEQGLPREVQVSQSAGFPRLDDAALAAVRKTRFKPCIENGVAISGWAFIPIEFELES